MNTRENSYDLYKKVEIETASNEKLVLLLLEGAIRFMTQAREALADGRLEDVHVRLVRSQDIITELNMALKMDAGEVSRNLTNIYDFIYYKLVEANLKKEDAPITEAIRILEPIRDAWQEAMTISNGAPAAPVGASASASSAPEAKTPQKPVSLDIRG